MSRYRRILIHTIAYMIIASLMLAGCGKKDDESINQIYNVYYITSDRTGVECKEYNIDVIGDNDIINRLITLMELSSADSKLSLNDVRIDGNMVILDFNDEYNELSETDEVLIRMAIVKTLTQVPSIDKVLITSGGMAITNGDGKSIGATGETDYIVAGDELTLPENSCEVVLYFGDKSADRLVTVNRSITYFDGNRLEEVIVRLLIEGPIKGEKYNRTINRDTMINSVKVIDDVCHVDFTADFLKVSDNSRSNMAVYSVVNSLTSLDNINAVIISVDGDTNAGFLADYSDVLYANYGISL